MSKKRIMLSFYGISLTLLLVGAMLSFSLYPKEMIQKGKEIVTAQWPHASDGDEVIDALYAAAEEASADLALMLSTGDGQFDYYRTESDPTFIPLEGLELGQTYATDPKDGEEKLRGFFFLFGDCFKIAPLRSLRGSDAELLRTRIMVYSSDLPSLRTALAQNGAELEPDSELFEQRDVMRLISTLQWPILFFFFISAVFYAFARAKDMIVKKTLGYGDWSIVWAELRKIGSTMLLIAGALLVLIGLLFSTLAGFSSTLLFFRKSAGLLGLGVGLPLLIVALCIRVISGQCNVSHSKGKRLDRQLYAATVVFKTLVILVLAGNLTTVVSGIITLRQLNRETEAASALSEGYARLYMSRAYEDSIESPVEYYPRLYEFYTRMHEEYNLIEARCESLLYEIPAFREGVPLQYFITVNDNYLDSFDTIYDADGVPIHSDRLKQGVSNYMVPLDYEVERMFPAIAEGEMSAEDYHFIRYDAAKSKFFTFSNEAEGGYGYSREAPVLVSVDDPLLGEDIVDKSHFLQSALSRACFTYDVESELSPRAQILPLLQETGLDRIFLAAPPIKEEFLSQQKNIQDLLMETTVQVLLFLLAFEVLVVYAAELYYKIYAKDIAAKALAGYSFLDLFALRMALKLVLLPALILLPKVAIFESFSLTEISPPAAFACLTLELGLFILCMKKNMRHKVAAVMKGE